MNLSLIDPFILAQDYPESTTGSIRSGHSTCVRFNRKGDFLAAGRVDGTVVIFDVETNGVVRKLKGHTRQVQSLSWSADGRYLLTSSQDWRCIIWDLQDGSVLRSVRFESPVYIAEQHPSNHLKFVVCLYDDHPELVDATEHEVVKYHLPTKPKITRYNETIKKTKQAQPKKHVTTVAVFTATGEHVLSGTSEGWLNIIDVATQTIIYSVQMCDAVVVLIRLTSSGRDIVVNAADRAVRTAQLPNLTAADLDPDTIDMEVEHKFADVVNRLSWNHVCFSSTGEYVCASTFNNHDIYIWERTHGSLVKILEGTKGEHGVVEWHPHRPLIAACGVENGTIFIWSIVPEQRWSALAPDFIEVEENVEYVEHEDEFDIHAREEIHKRRLDAEDEDVDVLVVEPVKGVDEENLFRMPVQLDLNDSEGEEEFITVGRGEMRRKSPTEGRNYSLEGDLPGSGGEGKKSKSKRKR